MFELALGHLAVGHGDARFRQQGRQGLRPVVSYANGPLTVRGGVELIRWGDGADDEVLYLSSADWMSRNLVGRIEIAWPVRDAALRQRVIDEALVPYLHDERDAWAMEPDGSYRRVASEGVSAQRALMQRYSGS